MKKGIILSVCALFISFGVSAQVFDKNAIGIKIGGATGDFSGTGTQISYQRGLNDINRLELGLSFTFHSSHSTLGIDGFYQWVRKIDGGFNWFVGPGASIGSVSIKHGGSEMLMGVGGVIGIEYRFPKTPIQLSLDITPIFGLINSQGFYSNFGLGIRYCF